MISLTHGLILFGMVIITYFGTIVTPVDGLTNLVQNPGFETGDFSHWVVSGNTGDTTVHGPGRHPSAFAAYLGAIGDDNHPKNDHLTQILSNTVKAGTYTISFWLANGVPSTPNGPPPEDVTPNQFDVLFNNVLLSAVHNRDEQRFVKYTFSLIVTSDENHSLKIRFNSRNDPDFFILDDISVTRS